MMSLFKIFGISSLVMVLFISLFDFKRPTIGEERSIMAINDASRLYFKNVRQLYYDREIRDDAMMNVYRFAKREIDEKQPLLNLSIIINRLKDEAYVFLEPSVIFEGEGSIQLRWLSEDKIRSGSIEFIDGDRFDHYSFVEKIYPLLVEEASFEVHLNGDWYPILKEQKERDAFRITSFDYFRLTGREEIKK